uniref:AMP-activated protein kinase glycogen-binding domain-containing protein n=1 Tax=Erythrolobus madagascarensis TaxID=708628 RepID=A0A7S0XJ04_9RHOD|mmetsp:Transcript_2993/g.6438  ORF Transcript_2993/g.6438 Transcript_2993/m.6438 type:complete len:526 (+) Transcript_2993:98-1675(+)|eukprot:CAMPEP_0185851394 /NCGR_PEP_ID=MMETSP1354-20130828/9320_1 /TAXON_ID=708628 /ORGANISM="Erythrolobus madagascarensis, Strain CCMP3276" /LENGTH=525 /DNA_ID=CAMNT_0028552371 /DNA_START=56 /DNA_END=1633 /DNA_ORIENTATION=-
MSTSMTPLMSPYSGSKASSACDFTTASSYGFRMSESPQSSSSALAARANAHMTPSVLHNGPPPADTPPVPNIPRPNGSPMGRELAGSSTHSRAASLASSARSSVADFSDVTPEDRRQQSSSNQQLATGGIGVDDRTHLRGSSSGYDFDHLRPSLDARSHRSSAQGSNSGGVNNNTKQHYLFQPAEIRNSNRSSPKDELAARSEHSSEHQPRSHHQRSSANKLSSHNNSSSKSFVVSPPSESSLCGSQHNANANGVQSGGGVMSGSSSRSSCGGKRTLAWKCEKDVKTVAVAGSWIKWKQDSMMRVDRSRWCTDLELPVGVHYFKYVVNGKEWVVDEEAEKKHDPYGNVNNVLRVGLFEATFVWDKTPAKEVKLTGSFDGWKTQRKMEKVTNDEGKVRFEMSLPLPIGLYEYKFIVDGEWFFDVSMPVSGFGGAVNNQMALGSAAHEFVWDKTDAKDVKLIGSFDKWNTKHPMRKVGNKWVLERELPPGRYEYKFVVDGNNWWFDTSLPHCSDPYGNCNNSLEHCV